MTCHYATLFDASYLLKGLCLIRSMQQHLTNYRLHVLALDRATWEYLEEAKLPNVEVERLPDIGSDKLLVARQNRSWGEFCWTLASVYLAHRLEKESTCYIDADTFFMDSDWAVWDEVDKASIALTPHRFDKAHEFRLENGKYNVNFVCARKDRVGIAFVKEWRDMTLNWCYARNENGLFGDQAYLDTLVKKYPVHEIQNIGCNCAPWNAYQYTYRKDGNAVYVSDGIREDKLCHYHLHESLFDDNGNMVRRTNWKITDSMIEYIYKPYESLMRTIAREVSRGN